MSESIEAPPLTSRPPATAPWAGMSGVPTSFDVDEALVQTRLNWGVEKTPMYRMVDGQPVVVPKVAALIRTDTGGLLAPAGDKYIPVQNRSMFEFFQRFADRGGITLADCGSLDGGRFVWGSARLNSFEIGEDVNENRILFLSPHVPGYSLAIDFSSIRISCLNSYLEALSAEGTGSRFKMRHVHDFERLIDTAQETVLAGLESSRKYAEKARFLATHRVGSRDDLTSYLRRVFKLHPEDLAAAQAEESRKNGPLARALSAYATAPGSQLPSAGGTWWGAFNSVTYVIDHELGRTADRRLFESWVGTRRGIKQRALEVALEMAA